VAFVRRLTAWGALQRLDQRGIVAKARWILGVSGGSYIASSRALVARHLDARTTPAAYAPGTPEERNLRCDTHYIAPDAPTVLVGVLSLLLGAVATFVIALAPLYALAHAIAHFLGFGARPSWSLSGLAGVIAAVAAVARYCQAGLAKWTAPGSTPEWRSTLTRAQ
jgi:hypothetical protein